MDYLHFEVRSRIFQLVDDLEFLLDAGGSRIEIRSASRKGYWDLGVNRRRVEFIQRAFREAMDLRLAKEKAVQTQSQLGGGLKQMPEALHKPQSSSPGG